MFGLGTTEIMLIVGAGIVIFGAKKLPEIGSAIGKGLKNFKKAVETTEEAPSPSTESYQKPPQKPTVSSETTQA